MPSPIKFAHVVLKTRKYQEMVSWWCDFLEGRVRHGDDFISFQEEYSGVVIDLTQSTHTVGGVVGLGAGADDGAQGHVVRAWQHELRDAERQQHAERQDLPVTGVPRPSQAEAHGPRGVFSR